jgi:hypothetical protein
VHDCFIEGKRIAIPELVSSVRAAEKNPSRWRLVPTRINFTNPPVNFGENGIYHWLNSEDSTRQAIVAINAAGCRASGSCFEEVKVAIKSDPRYILIPGGVLAGVILGWVIARVARRPVVAGGIVTLLPISWELVTYILMHKTNSHTAFIVGFFSFYAFVPFLVAFWITISVVCNSRDRSASKNKAKNKGVTH